MQKIAKRAVDAALKANWELAIELNKQILELDPNNINAKNRLGRAYIQTDKLDNAKKMFNEVLKRDPINAVAKKNLKLLDSSVKNGNGKNTLISTDSLVKEPGTSLEISLELIDNAFTADDFIPGEILLIKRKRNQFELTREDSKRAIAKISNENVINKLTTAYTKKAKILVLFVKGKGRKITIIIKCSLPVFKSQRQDIRPYVKKGTIEEPEIEIPENELTTESA